MSLVPGSVFILAGIDTCFPAFCQEVLVSCYSRGSQDLHTKRCGHMDIWTYGHMSRPSCLPIDNVQEGLARSKVRPSPPLLHTVFFKQCDVGTY